jgi:hypothetical protein
MRHPPIYRDCPVCGKRFKVHVCHLDRIKHCSKSCREAAYHFHSRRGQISSTYSAWVAMKRRCYGVNTKSYPYYGARGIKVCQSWDQFENFLVDMGERPKGMTLDRIDPNGDYCRQNCHWATRTVQSQNRRGRKLNWKIASEIRRLRTIERLTYSAIGKRFGISNAHAHKVALGEQWRTD